MTDRFTSLEPSTRILLEAVIAMSSDLDLHGVLQRIVRSASQLTDAQYGALGVLSEDGASLVDLITWGLDPEQEQDIPVFPHGRGLLGVLIELPEPLRLGDLSQHPQSYGFPPGHPPMRSFLGVPVLIRGTVFGNLYLTQKRGAEEFSAEDEALVQALATAAGYVIENARAFSVSERRRQWLEASAELTEALQPPIDHEAALARVCRTARTLTRARAVAIGTRDDRGPVASVAADPDERTRILEATEELSQRVPYRVEDVLEERVDGLTAIIAPMRAQLAGRGALVAYFDEPLAATEREERDLLASFADQAALALDRARAVEDRADLAVISDRERIARDLHDVVIQRLFATGLQLQALNGRITDPDKHQRLAAAVDALDQTIKDIRQTIFELQHRGGGSLRAEVRDLIREYVGVLGYTPVVHTSGPVDTGVPEKVRGHLLSVLREAVSNVARHARAKIVEIELAVSSDRLSLRVHDDGVGPGETGRESGLGNARRRATELGGSFELLPREPRGTSFVWTVPLLD